MVSCDGQLTRSESKDFNFNGPFSSSPPARPVCTARYSPAAAAATETSQIYTYANRSFQLGEMFGLLFFVATITHAVRGYTFLFSSPCIIIDVFCWEVTMCSLIPPVKKHIALNSCVLLYCKKN